MNKTRLLLSVSLYIQQVSLKTLYIFTSSFVHRNPAHSKLVMFVQTEMRGKLSPSIVEATMPSNLVSFILNAKDGIKTYKAASGHGHQHRGHSSFPKKK